MLKLAKKRPIIQKFLEPGHTHMEVDTMHKKIETSMKNRDINHPNDYIDGRILNYLKSVGRTIDSSETCQNCLRHRVGCLKTKF